MTATKRRSPSMMFERARILAYMRHARDAVTRSDLPYEDKQDFLREINLLTEAFEIKLKETA